jgi:fructose-specific component phosphotransferase system IIB-like protein
VAGRDITEGRATRAIAVDVGVVATTSIWQNTDVAYDVAIGGMPFIYSISDARPYIRQTAPFKKEQFDNQTEPGEQSLTGWWIRSQQSFHGGDGITFYDPANTTSNSPDHYRFADSKGVNVWDQGKVTLLKNVNVGHITTGALKPTGRPNQYVRSIKWNNTQGVLLSDEYDIDKIDINGVETHFVNYNSGTDAPVYAICDDGVNAYWITNTATKKTVYKKPLTGTSASTADVTLMFDEVGLISNATMEYVKERIVMCADNKVYEFAANAVAMPSPVYTHPSTTHVYTSVAASGPAIYVSGYNGIQSSIIKFTLSTAGVMPTLTSAITAAELPVGEVVHKIHYYLGYMMIGTNKGIRVATVNDNDGSLSYGPLIVETSQPCYDFASRDHYVWCATGVAGEPGVIRLDLSTEVSPLRFAYANDVYYTGITGHVTTGCAFANGTEQLVFATAAISVGGTITNKAMTSGVATLTTASAHNLASGDKVWVEGVDSNFNSTTNEWTITSATSTTFTYTSAVTATVSSTAVTSTAALANVVGSTYIEDDADLMPSGYLTTGFIRFNTLEPKNFKRLIARGDYEYGTMTLETVTADGTEYNVVTYDAAVSPVEVTTSTPQDAQEYLAYKFLLTRDTDDITRGPVMEGYQAKATIATPRQRVMRFPVYCYDVETDRYNVQVGYEGRAFDRIAQLESVEENGDVLTWQDLTTGESRQVVIEQVSFTRLTPPDRGFTGYGGVIDITIRTV